MTLAYSVNFATGGQGTHVIHSNLGVSGCFIKKQVSLFSSRVLLFEKKSGMAKQFHLRQGRSERSKDQHGDTLFKSTTYIMISNIKLTLVGNSNKPAKSNVFNHDHTLIPLLVEVSSTNYG